MVMFAKGKTAKFLDYDLEALAKQIIDNSDTILPALDIVVPDIMVQEVISKEGYLKLKAVEQSAINIINSLDYSPATKDILSAFYYCAIFQMLRAIKRDLEIDVDTYKLSINKEKAGILAGYIKPMLPAEIAIEALCEIDRWFYVDKEIRKSKGSWEKEVLNALIKYSSKDFKKRKFKVGDQKFKLDAAYPTTGDIVIVGVDVKRIEARQDIHKRADEIVNKASKYKKMFPEGKFFAVIYYPFTADHINLKERLESEDIDGIYFANETTLSIEQQAKYLLGKAKMLEIEEEETEE